MNNWVAWIGEEVMQQSDHQHQGESTSRLSPLVGGEQHS